MSMMWARVREEVHPCERTQSSTLLVTLHNECKRSESPWKHKNHAKFLDKMTVPKLTTSSAESLQATSLRWCCRCA
jgi:hypothetical protein